MHRDIKPNNIFIKDEDEDGEKKIVKLSDFGCSVYIKDNTSESIGTLLEKLNFKYFRKLTNILINI
jgi:serine/threonine protein kinase